MTMFEVLDLALEKIKEGSSIIDRTEVQLKLLPKPDIEGRFNVMKEQQKGLDLMNEAISLVSSTQKMADERSAALDKILSQYAGKALPDAIDAKLRSITAENNILGKKVEEVTEALLRFGNRIEGRY